MTLCFYSCSNDFNIFNIGLKNASNNRNFKIPAKTIATKYGCTSYIDNSNQTSLYKTTFRVVKYDNLI